MDKQMEQAKRIFFNIRMQLAWWSNQSVAVKAKCFVFDAKSLSTTWNKSQLKLLTAKIRTELRYVEQPVLLV